MDETKNTAGEILTPTTVPPTQDPELAKDPGIPTPEAPAAEAPAPAPKGKGKAATKPAEKPVTQPPAEDGKIEQEPTTGQMRVGISFNPGGSPDVNSIKEHSANAIDKLLTQEDPLETEVAIDNLKAHVSSFEPKGPEATRCLQKAMYFLQQTDGKSDYAYRADLVETAAMWAVKGVTKFDFN